MSKNKEEKKALDEFNLRKVKEFQETGNIEIVSEVIKKNGGLVYSMVRRYCYDKNLFQDALQEGFLGLMKAMKEYKSDCNAKFITYASITIEHSVIACLLNNNGNSEYPASAIKRFFQLKKIDNYYLNRGVVLTDEQLAESSRLSLNMVKNYRIYMNGPISFDTYKVRDKNGETTNFSKILIDESSLDFDSRLINRIHNIDKLKSVLMNIKLLLTEKEYNILMLRMGFKDGQPRTLEEVGQIFRVTRERIRQIETKALINLRNEFVGDKKYEKK